MSEYAQFLATKRATVEPVGFEVADADLNQKLFDWQRAIVRWALHRGRAALFEDCGLGKTPQQLEWAHQVSRHTGRPVLILAPLAVARQTQREGDKFGIPVTVCATEADVQPGVNITNYEKLHHFTPAPFGGIVLDECFAKGTMVDVFDGSNLIPKGIETIRQGDKIHNASGVDTVSAVYKREVEFVVKVKIGSVSDIHCSPNHPFFTQRGWVGAQDLRAGDYALGTGAAMRLVRDGVCPAIPGAEDATVLRSVLLSELAHASTGDSGSGAYQGDACADRSKSIAVVPVWYSGGECDDRAGSIPESNGKPGNQKSYVHDLACDEAQTFRAWGKWNGDDRAAAADDGCTVRRLDSGVCYITGRTSSRLSNQLQGGLGVAREENRHRGGWSHPSISEGAGREEGCKVGWARVDGIAILELGCPELDRFRDADGKLYFYDIKATRHPSFSVNGILVHNSSVLKAFDGVTRQQITEFARSILFRLACTATPAPNDLIEITNHAEFLDIMSGKEIIALYFKQDGNTTHAWRLKKHAVKPFYQWLASWSLAMRRPSDLGYEDGAFKLPPLRMHQVTTEGRPTEGNLFVTEAQTLMERRQARRASLADRVAACADRVNASAEQWIVWCDLNAESEALTKAIPDAVQVTGSDSNEHKERSMVDFADGRIRVLVSKPSICGFGMNFQNCHNMAFVGLSDSWEQLYQATRRCWRFGQTQPVDAYVITSDAEGAVVRNIERKEAQATAMFDGIIEEMNIHELNRKCERKEAAYFPDQLVKIPDFLIDTTL